MSLSKRNFVYSCIIYEISLFVKIVVEISLKIRYTVLEVIEMTTVQRIDYILHSRGMSRRQLAISAKIPPSSLQSAMTRGKSMTIDMLLSIADALDVDPYSLMDFDTASERLSSRINGELTDRLLLAFNLLNDVGQHKAIERVEELAEIAKYRDK